jgi:hypothetical protein
MRGMGRRCGVRFIAALAVMATGSLVPAAAAVADAPSQNGAFVIGDQAAAVGDQVTFWGAQWWKDDGLSAGPAPASFKGFADTATATCGEHWTTRPGNSSAPPPTVEGVLPMVVSSQITKSGAVISGDTVAVVLVQVDPGYQPDPGHPGTGTVIGIVCQSGGINAT